MKRRLTWRQWRLLAEAGLFVGAGAASVAFLPFARTARLASGRARGTVPRDPGTIRQIRWAIDAVARRAPFRAKCFERGLAAQWMLRRRGIAATLFYGIARDLGEGMAAHVWVRAGDFDVVGCENAGDYTLVARFPPDRTSTPASIR